MKTKLVVFSTCMNTPQPPPPPHNINVKRIHKKQWREDQNNQNKASDYPLVLYMPCCLFNIYKLIHLWPSNHMQEHACVWEREQEVCVLLLLIDQLRICLIGKWLVCKRDWKDVGDHRSKEGSFVLLPSWSHAFHFKINTAINMVWFSLLQRSWGLIAQSKSFCKPPSTCELALVKATFSLP
jgi:hypothetical protein